MPLVAIRLDAPCIDKGGQAKKQTKFVLAADTFESMNRWKEAIGEGGSFKVKGAEKGSMRALSALGDGGGMSEFDFYVTLRDKREARLAVTRASVQTFVQGKKIDDHKIESIASWVCNPSNITFTLCAGGKTFMVKTKEAATIGAAVSKQKTTLQQEQDATRAAAEAAAQRAAEEKAAADAAAAAEAAKWLTLEQLIAGEYDSCTQQPVDEKTKELWLCDEEFEKVFGKTKKEWESIPAFKKPIIKKKRGLV
eukprot:SAG31_NODE_2371_length_5851_cov_4.577886_4_plen_252_part_00